MDDLFEKMAAHDQDRAIGGFYVHFVVFVVVVALLAVVNIITGDEFWIHWVLLGWGLGVGLHAFLVFVRKPQKTRDMIAIQRAYFERVREEAAKAAREAVAEDAEADVAASEPVKPADPSGAPPAGTPPQTS